MPALDAVLADRRAAAVRFLTAAVALDQPTVAGVVAGGVPHWDAQDLLGRLTRAEEVTDAGWSPAARQHYRAAIAPPPAPRPLIDGLPEGERPREKALAGGIESLDDPELIALLLRTGTADQPVLALARSLIDRHGGLVGLSRRTAAELADEDGCGPAKAGELAAAFELGRRLASAAMRARPSLHDPALVAALVATRMVSLPHEELWCLPLDPRLRLIGEPRLVSKGDVDSTDGSIRGFFRPAISAGAVSVIAVHNHPSGDPTPSAADRALTARLCQAGRLLDIPLADHVVIGAASAFVSIRQTHPDCWRT
jgi:DNA repair protein RadC